MDVVLHYVMLGLTTLGGAFVGSYLGSYLKKKGENLAKKEDIDDLIAEVHAVTTTTKQIEAKISNEVWDRQKQWELRRDASFAAAKAAGSVKDTLTVMHGILMTDKQNAAQGKPLRPDKQGEAYATFNKACEELDQAFMLVAITCGDDVRNKVGEFMLFTRDLASEMADGKPEKFIERTNEFSIRFTNVAKVIRAEMGIKKDN